MTTGFTTSAETPSFERAAAVTPQASDATKIALTVGSRLVGAASQAAVLVLIARIGGTFETASFVWAMALAAPVFMFTNMNLVDVVSTETPQGPSIRDYWHARWVGTTTGLAILAVIVPVVSPANQWPVIAAVAIGKAVESINDLALGAYHRGHRADRAAVSLITRSVGGCLCLASILALTGSVVAGLTAMIIFQVFSLVAYDVPCIRGAAGPASDGARMRVVRVLRTALPLGIVACLTSLSLNVPRYVVNEQLDDQSLAAFGCCASFLQAFTLVGVATQLALCPRLASRNAQSRRLMNEMLWRHVLAVGVIGSLIVVAAHVWGPMALSFVYGREYGDFGPVLTWLMVAGTFAAAKGFLATGLTTTRSMFSQAPIAAAQFGCAAVGCLWLVPVHGVVAAAWVVAASCGLSFALHAVWTSVSARKGGVT